MKPAQQDQTPRTDRQGVACATFVPLDVAPRGALGFVDAPAPEPSATQKWPRCSGPRAVLSAETDFAQCPRALSWHGKSECKGRGDEQAASELVRAQSVRSLGFQHATARAYVPYEPTWFVQHVLLFRCSMLGFERPGWLR